MEHKGDLNRAIHDLAIHRRSRAPAGMLPYIEIGDISPQSKTVMLKEKLPVPNAQLAHSGDVLVSTVRPVRGAVATAPCDASVSPALTVLFAENVADTRFIFHVVSQPRFANYLDRLATGSTYPTCTDSDVLSFSQWIPVESERRAIAKILDTVNEAIRKTEALTAKQQRIKTGLMQDLLTRGIDERGNLRFEETHQFKDSPLGRIPVEWDVTPFGDTGDWFSGGTPSKTNKRYWGGDVPWVCPKDMKQFVLSTTIDRITPEAIRCGGRLMPMGTVFIVIRGMILAHTFPVGFAATQMAFNQDVKAIVPRSGLCDRYLAYWLVAHAHDMLKLATTATHGTKRFDMDELYSVPVAIPTPTEQAAITRILDEQQVFIERASLHTDKLRSLKTGLMQDLLMGEVRVTKLLKQKSSQTQGSPK